MQFKYFSFLRTMAFAMVAFLGMTCSGTAQTYFTEGFESLATGSFPTTGTGWIKQQIGPTLPSSSSTPPDWIVNAGTNNPGGYGAHGGSNLAYFNCYSAREGNVSRLISPTINLSAASGTVKLDFWMFHDDGYDGDPDDYYPDSIRVFLSTNGGSNWTYVSTHFRIATSDFWELQTVNLTGAAGQANVKIAFEAHSAYGDDMHIDDIAVYVPIPITFSSATTFQISNFAPKGAANTPVVVAQVNTIGTLNSLNTTSFTFNPNGTTSLADISNAKLWYTGTNTTFITGAGGTAVQLGSAIATISGGALTFTVNQSLLTGANYFWLTYDISPTAVLGNVVDGEFTSVTVGGTPRIPSLTAPARARTILPAYCQSSPNYINDEYISNVSLSTMNNSSLLPPGSGAAYEDYTSNPTLQLAQGRSYTHSVTVSSSGVTNYGGWINVFIDFNRDGVYDPTTERVFSKMFGIPLGDPDFNPPLPVVASGTVTIPANAQLGPTGMRVVIDENSSASSTACGIYDYGETEEYRVTIVQPGSVTVSGSTAFGNVGSLLARTITLTNPSALETVNVSSYSMSGSSAYKFFLPGTSTPVPSTFAIAPLSSTQVDIAFVNTVGVTPAGQQNGTVTLVHNGVNTPTVLSPTAFYASLAATDGAKDLLVPSNAFDVGGIQPGSGQISRSFTLAPNTSPMNSPINISSVTLTGPDAASFEISSLPSGISGNAVVAVTLKAAGASVGIKKATLTITHSGANGPTAVINITGSVGLPVIGGSTLVNVPAVAVGQTYSSTYENATFIPLTKVGAVDVNLLQNPVLTGSGASRFELLNNSGLFYIKGAFDVNGNVIIGGNGDINNLSNWMSASVVSPAVVSSTQPLLVAIRMRTAPVGTAVGTYNADILFSNGSGAGTSNAVNTFTTTVQGQVLNNPAILPFYPTQLAFGTVPLGTSSVQTLTVRNQSGVAGTVNLLITGSDYSFSNGLKTLSVSVGSTNAPIAVQVRFAPNTSGAANGTISATGQISGTLALSGTGLAASSGSIQLLLNGQTLGSSLDFGSVAVGTVGSRTITVVNNNVGPVTITSVSRSGANATQFSVGDMSTLTLEGNGGTATFSINFVPTSTSNPVKNGTITLFNSTGIPKMLDIVGTAVTSGANTVSVNLSPTSYDFGSAGGTTTFVLTNTGSSSVVVSAALVLGSSNFSLVDAVGSFPRTVGGNGGTTTLTVKFDNVSGTSGLRTGSLLVAVNGMSVYPSSSVRGTVGTGLLHPGSGGSGTQGVSGYGVGGSVVVEGVYPNPVRESGTLRYRLSESFKNVEVRLYNILGEEVMKAEGKGEPGSHELAIKAEGMVSGSYYYVLEADGERWSGYVQILK